MKRWRRRLLAISFWIVAVAIETATIVILYVILGNFRALVLLGGAAAGLGAGIGTYYLVSWTWPWARYKKDVGLEGPGCVHTLSSMALPLALINVVAVLSYWLAMKHW